MLFRFWLRGGQIGIVNGGMYLAAVDDIVIRCGIAGVVAFAVAVLIALFVTFVVAFALIIR